MSQSIQRRLILEGDFITCDWCGSQLVIQKTPDGKFRIPLPEHVSSGECATYKLTDAQIARGE